MWTMSTASFQNQKTKNRSGYGRDYGKRRCGAGPELGRKQHLVAGLILITKRCDKEFLEFVEQNATVPTSSMQPVQVMGDCSGTKRLASGENPQCAEKRGYEKVVLRIDPILTKKGVERAINVMEMGVGLGIKRIRFSFLDLYPHVLRRFEKAGLAIKQDAALADKWFDEIKKKDGISFESCGESSADFPRVKKYASGCVSQKDLDQMHIPLTYSHD